MGIYIDSVPEYLTRRDYLEIFTITGFNPEEMIECRMAPDGIHALVWAKDDNNEVIVNTHGFAKHRVFIPVRATDNDSRTTRVTDVSES